MRRLSMATGYRSDGAQGKEGTHAARITRIEASRKLTQPSPYKVNGKSS